MLYFFFECFCDYNLVNLPPTFLLEGRGRKKNVITSPQLKSQRRNHQCPKLLQPHSLWAQPQECSVRFFSSKIFYCGKYHDQQLSSLPSEFVEVIRVLCRMAYHSITLFNYLIFISCLILESDSNQSWVLWAVWP